jgi:hypothetical protein
MNDVAANVAAHVRKYQMLEQLRRVSTSSEYSTELQGELEEGKACVICFSRPSQVVLAPCGHKHICALCMIKLVELDREECPTCKATFQSIVTTIYE